MWMTILFGASAAMFLLVAVAGLKHLRWAQRLPALAALANGERGAGSPNPATTCSVVVAVRDEEARVEGTVRHLLAQRDVAIDVIVVDDRSTDGTPGILRRLAAEDARMRVIRVDVLPDGWLGKCHACHVGASAATGEWILFTDADCWLRPDVIARALLVSGRDDADHVTLTPGVSPETLAARAWHLALLTRLSGWIAAVNRDRPNSHLGIGAFNLVRASAYRACGGYEALRLTVVDDVKLGLLLRRAGARTRAFIGGDDMECRWGSTVREMIGIMEKNYFAAADYRLAPIVVGGSIGILMVGSALAGPWTGTPAGIAAALAPFSLIAPAAILARRLRWSFAAALLTPVVFPVLWYAVINSAVMTLRRGGVRWRETFYPLDVLRRGTVR
jgi:Glycosyl transferase family 2